MVDWSATAAWIALAISITGTVFGPIITTVLTNRYQLNLHKLDIEEKQAELFLNSRKLAIENFMSHVGKYIAYPYGGNLEKCGEYFFQVYPYAPEPIWRLLDRLYFYITEGDFDNDLDEIRKLFCQITRVLADSLKEPPPMHP